jgi:hypothetical protein
MTIVALNSPDQLRQLEPWLKSFDHQLQPRPVGTFHLFTRMERTLALTQQTQINAVFPAVNPKVCTPRETTEIVECLRHWGSNMPGGLAVSVPSDSHMHNHMKSLGYRPASVLYEPIP